MIPIKSSTINESGGVIAETTFGAKAENLGFLFDILRSQLYSDAIMAVVREYSTNAIDANIMAGKKTTPIKISFPTFLDCFYKVRDFGKGLTDEEITKIFASYGESTKRLTQDATGMLGIGCKSGFAYNDSFIVNSYRDGQMSVWNAFIDPTNLGKMDLLARTETTEPDGIEIVIPVKSEDINKFHQKGAWLFKFFEVTPDVVNLSSNYSSEMELYKKTTWLFKEDNWKLMGSRNSSYAIMGNIPYIIDPNAFTAVEMTNDLRAILATGLHVQFPNGELEFAASREALRYTEHTKVKIVKRLEEIRAKIIKEVDTKFKNCKTLWDAKIEFGKLSTSNYSQIMEVISSHLTFNGTKVSDIYFKLSGGISCHHYQENGKYVDEINRHKVKRSYVANIPAQKDTIVVLNDKKIDVGIMNRVLPLFFEKNYKNVFIVQYMDDKAEANFKTSVGFDGELLLLSSLPKKSVSTFYPSNRKPTTGAGKYSKQCFEFNRQNAYSRYAESSYWEIANIDPEKDAGVYVCLNSFSVQDKYGGYMRPYSLVEIMDVLNSAGIKIPKVYGVKSEGKRTAAWELIKKNKNMVSFWAWTKTAFAELMKTQTDVPERISDQDFYNGFLNLQGANLTDTIEGFKKYDSQIKSPEIKKLVEGVSHMRSQKLKSTETYRKAAKICDFTFGKGTPKYKINEDYELVKTQYPMLPVVLENGSYGTHKHIKTIVDYINLVDSVKP